MLEKVYEVIDAIEQKNRKNLCEELGGLLLQVIYHATIAQEEGSFTFEDIVYAITAKMIRRHPHVFGNAEKKIAQRKKQQFLHKHTRKSKTNPANKPRGTFFTRISS